MTPQTNNPFALAAQPAGAAVQTAQGEIMQHLQAGYVMAAKRPRDQHTAFQRIIQACERRGLAEESSYLYSRGGTAITGASIRLLEAIFTCWGNVQSGVIELDQKNGESQMMAFAIDLETNCYDSKIFSVRHERYSKNGITRLEDPTDIYLHVANFAARRKRSCMEAVIPRDVIDAALEQCDKTLNSGHSEPLVDRTRKMVTAFADFQVTVEMLERRLQHKLEAISEQEMVILRKIYTSLKDGMGKREDFFDLTAQPKGAKFDEQKKDEKAEAAAGLAPAQPPSMANVPPQQPAATPPVTPPPATAALSGADQAKIAAQERMAKAREARAAKRAAMATAPVEPAPPAPPAPVPPQPQDLFGKTSASPVNRSQELATKAYAALTAHSMTEAEVLQVFKDRDICAKDVEQLVQLSDETLEDFIDETNTEMIASQVRINRRFAAKK